MKRLIVDESESTDETPAGTYSFNSLVVTPTTRGQRSSDVILSLALTHELGLSSRHIINYFFNQIKSVLGCRVGLQTRSFVALQTISVLDCSEFVAVHM